MKDNRRPIAIARTPITQDTEVEGRIPQRAYELYEARGREDGQDLDDLLSVEEKMTSKPRAATA